jgi:hypothetical protein
MIDPADSRWNATVTSLRCNAHAQRHAASGFLHGSNRLHLQLVVAAHLKIHAADDVRENGNRLNHGKPPAHAVPRAAAERNERISVVFAFALRCEEPLGPKGVRFFKIVGRAMNPPNRQIKSLRGGGRCE